MANVWNTAGDLLKIYYLISTLWSQALNTLYSVQITLFYSNTSMSFWLPNVTKTGLLCDLWQLCACKILSYINKYRKYTSLIQYMTWSPSNHPYLYVDQTNPGGRTNQEILVIIVYIWVLTYVYIVIRTQDIS